MKRVIKKIMPASFVGYCKLVMSKLEVYYFNRSYYCVIDKLKKKKKIRVAFFLVHSSVWKYDELFRLMLADERFDPVVVICPYIVMGEQIMWRDMAQAEDFVRSKGYPYTSTYDSGWVDIKKVVKPDVIFYTNPHEGLTRGEYYIKNFPRVLNCYVPYSSMICNIKVQFDKPLQNMVWRMFIENELVMKIAREQMPTKGENCYVSGFPPLDIFLDESYAPAKVWKNENLKKIIWAPHHTIERGSEAWITFSNFLEIAEPMRDLALKYSNKVQFAFKPHPLLRGKLEREWGKARTDEYYDFWSSNENSQFENGEYIDLFATSDAMIFDSVSFINEYLYTRKPSFFVMNDSIAEQLNEFGLAALACHKQGRKMGEIERFVEGVVDGVDDDLAGAKSEYYRKYLLPPHSVSASRNIVDYLKRTLSQEKCKQ